MSGTIAYMATIAFILAVILGILGVKNLLEGAVLWGALLIIAAVIIAPSGYHYLR